MSVDLIEKLAHKTGQQGAQIVNEAEGIVEAFVSGIGNKDHVGDIVESGAFDASLRRRKPRVIWGHEWNRPIRKVLEMYEVRPGDPRLPEQMRRANIGGLYAKVQFNLLTDSGKEAFANVAFYGEEQQWSIGYKTVKSARDPQMKANRLIEVELFEISPVLHGANQLTSTVSIKAADTVNNVTSSADVTWSESSSNSHTTEDHYQIPAPPEEKAMFDFEIDEKGGMMMRPGTQLLKEADDYMLVFSGGKTMMIPKMKVGGETYYGKPKEVEIQPMPMVANTKPAPEMADEGMEEMGGDSPMANMRDEDENKPEIMMKRFGIEVLSEIDEVTLAEKMVPFNVTVDGTKIVFNTVEAEDATKQLIASALEDLGVSQIKPFRTTEGTE